MLPQIGRHATHRVPLMPTQHPATTRTARMQRYKSGDMRSAPGNGLPCATFRHGKRPFRTRKAKRSRKCPIIATNSHLRRFFAAKIVHRRHFPEPDSTKAKNQHKRSSAATNKQHQNRQPAPAARESTPAARQPVPAARESTGGSAASTSGTRVDTCGSRASTSRTAQGPKTSPDKPIANKKAAPRFDRHLPAKRGAAQRQ